MKYSISNSISGNEDVRFIKTKNKSKFELLKKNLYSMAELILEETLNLCDILEEDEYEACIKIFEAEDLINNLENENDNISQSAILDAVISHGKMGLDLYNSEYILKSDPLRFALFGLRINIYFELIGDSNFEIAKIFNNQNIPKNFFKQEEIISLILARLSTLIGMAVESLVEEKEHFYGSIREVSNELNEYIEKVRKTYIENNIFNNKQISDFLTILTNIENIGSLALSIAKEHLFLASGADVRHAK